MAKYRCTVCNYIYDDQKEGKKFSELPENWRCPICNAPREAFVLLSDDEEGKDSKKEEEADKSKKEPSTVSDVIVEQMAEWGVRFVFGLPGTSSLGVVDAVRKNKKLRYVQVRHEQCAAFMASAYGKLTGHIASCLTIAGPGATNLATGLYDAKLDHSPTLALTGLVKRQLIGPGSFQEIDQHSFFEPITVFNKVLMSENQATTLVTLAIKHALVERGVSHISIPNDVQKLPYKTKIIPMEGMIPGRAVTQCGNLVRKAAKVIDRSKRPVIVSGFGALKHGEILMKFAKKISAPIVTTFRGKGVVDEFDDIYAGSHGTISSTSASKLVKDSDLLIVLGCSFSDMTNLPEKKTIQVDIDPMMIAKKYPVEVGLWGNSSELIPALFEKVSEKNNTEYLEEARGLKREWLSIIEKEADVSKKPIRPQYIIKVLNDKLPDDTVISLDIGENGWWFGRNFLMKKTQELVMSGYLASMGAGLPGAMAAHLAYPERPVACITGDGGFSMVMEDFLTAVKYNMPIKIFLFNNHQLGMIMQEQKIEKYPNWQTGLHNCDFSKFAENCKGAGIKVTKPADLEDAVEKALSFDKPVIVDIETDPVRFV